MKPRNFFLFYETPMSISVAPDMLLWKLHYLSLVLRLVASFFCTILVKKRTLKKKKKF